MKELRIGNLIIPADKLEFANLEILKTDSKDHIGIRVTAIVRSDYVIPAGPLIGEGDPADTFTMGKKRDVKPPDPPPAPKRGYEFL